jgi:hypothetical protein
LLQPDLAVIFYYIKYMMKKQIQYEKTAPYPEPEKRREALHGAVCRALPFSGKKKADVSTSGARRRAFFSSLPV